MEFKEANLLYRVRKTVLQMLKDRGYVVSEKMDVEVGGRGGIFIAFLRM
jgi:predicted transcriptional regulator